ncbi:hypothetical protein ACFZCL_14330 [Streptomyces sp. NPDC008159]|uniref:hypothetical protein n=1 Tax=Streptomyces sp. NPDC008159 TaxID=3364817 RepID=UPI0036E387A5
MTTKTGKTAGTFEDRLLGELQREIALRAADRTEEEPVLRRRVTPRRALVALAACAVAAGVVVGMPSSTGGPQAYAVERNDDGTVTVSMEDIGLSGDELKGLSERLRADDISVTVDRPRDGFVCDHPRGDAYQPGWIRESSGGGDVMPVHAFTLRPGDSLVFEEPQWKPRKRMPASVVYAFKGQAEPCREVPWDGAGAAKGMFEEK